MGKTALIISTLDTKRQETFYLAEKLGALDLNIILMDMSMRGGDPSQLPLPVDRALLITPAQVAESGGSSLEHIHGSKERSQITNIIISGASGMANRLYQDGKIDGVIGLGGSTGSLMATEVMRSLPFGLPKLMISSTAALPGLSTRYIGTGDIALFHSVIEISGMTKLLENVFDRAAHAMGGMIQGEVTSPRDQKEKAIAMTMLGPCEKCARSVRRALIRSGFQVTGFSAAGIGDRAMEEMIAQGLFQGVVDLAPGGVGEHLYGFMRDAGPNRMESAGVAGIPQVISTCSVNHMTPAKSKYKPEWHQRRKYDLDKFRTWLRMSSDELKDVATTFSEKLNRAKGPVKVIIPLKGWSSVDVAGSPTYDPAEDRIFIDELREKLNPDMEILEVDANMEDPEFSKALVKTALEIF